MKKTVGMLVFALGFIFLPSASANQKQSIVIVDTAVDSSVVNIFHEVCIMSVNDCPNNKRFMQGKGAASLPKEQLYSNNFDHGNKVSLVAQKINPNVNIIFIRIVPRTETGKIGYYSDTELMMAIDWTIKNRKKFNIVSISYSSFSHEVLPNIPNYCPVYSTTEQLKSKINKLKGLGIPLFFPTGNVGDKTTVSYPACIQEAISVGATNEFGTIESYSNEGIYLDFNTLGNYKINNEYIYGTSFSAAALSAFWAKTYLYSYDLTYNYLRAMAKSSIIQIS